MIMLYSNLCYNEVCYKTTALLYANFLFQIARQANVS